MSETLDRYWAQFMPRASHGVVIRADDGSVYTQWDCQSRGKVGFPPSANYEQFERRGDYGYTLGFGGAAGFSPVSAIKDYITVNGAVVIERSGNGILFAPWSFNAGDVIVVKQWGFVDGATRFYYEATFDEIGAQVTNNKWQGDGPRTRATIRQREAWWDDTGWARGHANEIPYGPDGKPREVPVYYDYITIIAKDAGICWAGTFLDPYNVALQNVTWGATFPPESVPLPPKDDPVADDLIAALAANTAAVQANTTAVQALTAKLPVGPSPLPPNPTGPTAPPGPTVPPGPTTPPPAGGDAIPWSTQRVVVPAMGGDTKTLTLDVPAGSYTGRPGVLAWAEYPPGVRCPRPCTVTDSSGNVLGQFAVDVTVRVGVPPPDAYSIEVQPGQRYYFSVQVQATPSTNGTFGIGFGTVPG